LHIEKKGPKNLTPMYYKLLSVCKISYALINHGKKETICYGIKYLNNKQLTYKYEILKRKNLNENKYMIFIINWWWEKFKNLYKLEYLIEWNKEKNRFISLMSWELSFLLFKKERIDGTYSIYVTKNEGKTKSQQNICCSIFN